MTVVLTNRDLELIRLLNQARWLTTQQVHQYYFRDTSVNACQKRLRKLAEANVIANVRPSRTAQSLWRIGAKRTVQLHAEGTVIRGIPKRIPGNLDHFLAINDLRLWFMRQYRGTEYSLKFFLAEWELKAGRKLQVIPDALLSIEDSQRSSLIVLEVDLGTENLGFFGRTKIENYRAIRLIQEQPANVLVLVPERRRLVGIIRKLYGQPETQYFFVAEIQSLLAGDFQTSSLISLADPGTSSLRWSIEKLLRSPHRLSSREETLKAIKG